MYAVRLISFPQSRHERIERVIHKHSATLAQTQGPGAQLAHGQRLALLHEVAAGRPQVFARYAEHEVAEHAAAECTLQGAVAEVTEEGGA